MKDEYQQGAVDALCIAVAGMHSSAHSHRKNLEVWHTKAALHIKMTKQFSGCEALGMY